MADVQITTGQGTLPAYLSEPKGDRRRPGVVVIHDVFGMGPSATEARRRNVAFFDRHLRSEGEAA